MNICKYYIWIIRQVLYIKNIFLQSVCLIKFSLSYHNVQSLYLYVKSVSSCMIGATALSSLDPLMSTDGIPSSAQPERSGISGKDGARTSTTSPRRGSWKQPCPIQIRHLAGTWWLECRLEDNQAAISCRGKAVGLVGRTGVHVRL